MKITLSQLDEKIRNIGEQSERLYEEMGRSYGWRGAVLETQYNRTLSTLKGLETRRDYLVTSRK